MTTTDVRDLGQSALSAFRADIPIGGRELTSADNDTIAVATLLRHATTAPASPASRRMLRRATRIAKQLLGTRRMREGCLFDVPGSESPLDVFRAFSQRCNEYGQLRLEDHILASLERLAPPDSITVARVLSSRANVAWALGETDFAQTVHETLLHEAKWRSYEEVRLRALLDLGVLANTRGNTPAFRDFTLRMLRESGDRYPRLVAAAWSNLGIVAALTGDFDSALQYQWKAYDVVKSASLYVKCAGLVNISQTLLDSGHPAAARAGFAGLLAGPIGARAAYPTLGGYASASAALGDLAGLEWAIVQVLLLAKVRTHPRQLADALLECSMALTEVGQDARAGTMRRRSLRLSERYGFHDLIFKAQQKGVKAVASPSRLTEASEAIMARISEMEPDRLPTKLVYAD